VAVSTAGRRVAVVAALLVVLAGAPGAADYRDAYKAGLDAMAKKQWAEAARQMRLAIAERPEPGGVLFLRRYTPQYHLGVALLELGDCRGAVDAFDAAEAQGKLDREEQQDLVRRRQGCRQRIGRTAEAVAAAQRDIDAAAAAAVEVARVERTAIMREAWSQGSPSFEARQKPAMDRLAAARGALANADRDLDAVAAEGAGRMAQEARSDLEAIARDAAQRRDELLAAVEAARTELGKLAAASQRELDFVTRSLAPLPPDVARRATQLGEVLAAVRDAGSETPLADLTGLQERVKTASRDLRAAVRPPPDELQQAARAYFAGDYPAALAALGQRPFRDARAAAHACLLKAAALHGAHLAGAAPGEDPALAELRLCKQLPVRPKVPAAAFPPTFLALHAAVAAEAAPTPAPQ
jgi:hypothetical protein